MFKNQELIEIRHYLHAHPELSSQEFQTTAFLKEKLEGLDIEILQTPLKTGLIAQIGSGSPVIALRADIDALPITEETALNFSSKNPAVMHACGHDLHMTSLLGAAARLKVLENELQGTIKLIFQPAEETGTGANQVIATGDVNDVQAFIGYHNIPTLGVGVIGLREKGVMAACERFEVQLKGIGSHAAQPEMSHDPILALTTIVQSLQSIVARNVSAFESVVLSITHIEAGDTWNVIPDKAFFEGTIRTFDENVRARVKQRFTEVIENTAKALEVQAKIIWKMTADLTYNDPELTKVVDQATKAWHKETIVQQPASVAEDFANYRHIAPSVFAFIGSNEAGSPELHQSKMIVSDEALPIATEYLVQTALAVIDFLK